MQRISITNPQNIIDGTAKKYYFKLRNTGGPKGDKGDKGDTGQTGPQGPKGDAATVAVGSTTTLAVGQNATVENVGSIYNAVLNFGIPQGPQGPQGAKGDKGDTGAQGETGPRGPQGERGTNATVDIGTTSTLNPGSQATVYNSGSDSNAVLNFGIPKGEKGDTGPMPTIAQTTGQSTTEVMSQKATTDALNTKQATISSSNKLSADLVTDSTTTNKFVTAEDKTAWNAKQDALTAGNNIDIEDGVISTPAIAPEVVAELPATGAEGKLYLTPKNYTRGTGTGNPITATITDEAGKMESFKLDGDTFQQTYTGKNLLGPYAGYGTDRGITATPLANGKINLNGTTTTTWFVITPNSEPLGTPIAPGTYTFSTDNAPAGFKINVRLYTTGSSSYDELTIAAGATSITGAVTAARDRYYIYGGGTAAGTEISGDFALQLESGSPATAFEKFVGGTASPNPDYPQPIQTVTGEQTVKVIGKNLFNKDASTEGYLNSSGAMITGTNWVVSDYMPVKEGQKYTISGTVVAGTEPKSCFYDSSKTFVSSFANGNKTITIPSGVSFMRASVFAGNAATPPDLLTYMLELGESATAYAPYHATSYPINLGKNLYNKATDSLGYYLDSNGDSIAQGDSWRISEYVSVQPGEQYTFSGLAFTPNAPRFCYYDSSKSFVSAITRPTGANTVTIPAGVYYIRFSIYDYVPGSSTSNQSHEASSFQFEAGSTASSYAPYKTPIKLCKLGGYQDYIYKDGNDWKVHKATAAYTLNGTESWSETSTGVPYTTAITDYALSGNTPVSEYFIGATNRAQAATLPDNNIGFNDTNSAVRLWVKYLDKWSTGASVATWLAQNPATIYYALKSASQTDTTITDSTLIAQLEAIRTASLENGTNTISNAATAPNLAGDMEVGYYGYNPRNRYDKFIWLDLNNNYEQIGS